MLQLAIGERSGGRAWDACFGVGLFAQALNFEHVTAVESEGFSADGLKKNLAQKTCRIVRADALDFYARPHEQNLNLSWWTRLGRGWAKRSALTWQVWQLRKSCMFPATLQPWPEIFSHCYNMDIPCRR